MHNLNVTTVHCSYMFRLLQNNHRQVVRQTYKRKLFPSFLNVLYTLMIHILNRPKHVAAIYNCYIIVVHSQIIFFYYLLSFRCQLFILVPL